MVKDEGEVTQAIEKAKNSIADGGAILVARNIADPAGAVTIIETSGEMPTQWINGQLGEAVVSELKTRSMVITVESVWDIRKQRYHSITTSHRRFVPKVANGGY